MLLKEEMVTSSTSRWYIENKQAAFLRPLMPAPQPLTHPAAIRGSWGKIN